MWSGVLPSVLPASWGDATAGYFGLANTLSGIVGGVVAGLVTDVRSMQKKLKTCMVVALLGAGGFFALFAIALPPVSAEALSPLADSRLGLLAVCLFFFFFFFSPAHESYFQSSFPLLGVVQCCNVLHVLPSCGAPSAPPLHIKAEARLLTSKIWGACAWCRCVFSLGSSGDLRIRFFLKWPPIRPTHNRRGLLVQFLHSGACLLRVRRSPVFFFLAVSCRPRVGGRAISKTLPCGHAWCGTWSSPCGVLLLKNRSISKALATPERLHPPTSPPPLESVH
jgi:hypothetical protein